MLHLEIANLDMVESLYGWQVFDRVVARVPPLTHQLVARPVRDDMSANYARLCARYVMAVAQKLTTDSTSRMASR